ncbi:MAG: hypothetical protein JWP38_552 [Herbaspirillum sp.]|jgi:hypothetical protein|nr:hypothetical protein [Herbaspirillum sp.]
MQRMSVQAGILSEDFMQFHYKLGSVAAVLLLGGCVSAPIGPRVMAMPGSGKNYDQFRQDEAVCEQYARQAIGDQPARSNDTMVNSAAAGTAIGAVAGALIGAAGGRAGEGAAIGAGGGLLMGSAAGSNNAAASGYNAQRRYDEVYTQCMYAHGNRVPVRGGGVMQRDADPYSGGRMPPPPTGYQPGPGYGNVPPDYVPQGAGSPPPPPGYR